MGNILGPFYYDSQKPDYLPDAYSEPTFPPEFGFAEPRKERVMKISEQEMKALRIDPEKRDYCAHLLADIFVCHRDSAPLWYFCKPKLHAYNQCLYEDNILRMKEYEREKRLRIRQKKIDEKAAA